MIRLVWYTLLLTLTIEGTVVNLGGRNITAGEVLEETTACEAPFVAIGNQCLVFTTFAIVNYQEAKQLCESMQSELASVLTPTMLKAIIDYIFDKGLDGESYWIDGSDQALEGDWRTSKNELVPMGTPFWSSRGKIELVDKRHMMDSSHVYVKGGRRKPADQPLPVDLSGISPRAAQEPNNAAGKEHCLHMYKYDFYYFNDYPCDQTMNAICAQTLPQRLIVEEKKTTACPLLYVEVGGLCLSFMTWADVTWTDARQSCHGVSGELATISDVEQLRAVYLYLHEEGIAQHSFWLGGSDSSAEGTWVWPDGTRVPSGSPFWGAIGDYTIEPDGGSTENCLALVSQGFHYFRDANCNRLMNPLCLYSP